MNISKILKKGDSMKRTIIMICCLAVLAILLVSCRPGGQAVQIQYPSGQPYKTLTCCVYPTGVKVGPEPELVNECYLQGGNIIACQTPAKF